MRILSLNRSKKLRALFFLNLALQIVCGQCVCIIKVHEDDTAILIHIILALLPLDPAALRQGTFNPRNMTVNTSGPNPNINLVNVLRGLRVPFSRMSISVQN